jgi:hypothetical protein
VKKTEGQTASVVKSVAEVEESQTQSPPHPALSPDGGEGDVASVADQQVRPTMTQGHSTETAVSPVKERAEALKISGGLTTTSEQHTETALAPLVRAATKAEVKEMGAQHIPTEIKVSKAEPDETAAEKTGMNLTGSLTTAATTPVVAANLKQKPLVSQHELSPYEKAIQGGQSFLSALYAQFAPVKNAQPKPPEDPSVPKSSPWDSFSEKVDVYAGFRPAPAINLRSALGRNTPG